MVRKLLVATLLVAGAAGFAMAQNTDNHTVTMTVAATNYLRIAPTGSKNISLTINAPVGGDAGEAMADASDSTLYLQYTVVANANRKITVAWGATDAAPAGTELQVTATPASATHQGTGAGMKVISDSVQDVITGILSCHTGIGAADGANLAYVLHITDQTLLSAGETTSATVTYSLIAQ